MAIRETDISILIPTYRYREKVIKAVRSALASGAGEIIVTDDNSGDGTLEALAGFDDRRLRVHENETNLGLWENHLHALSLATRPWIKFIQADDYLLPGGLAQYAAAAGEGVAVVWSVPTFLPEAADGTAGQPFFLHTLSAPRTLSTDELVDVCVHAGWILGSPSHVLWRSDALSRDPDAWKTSLSADLLNGSMAAVHGDVVLLPPGAIGQGVHDAQDARTQSVAKSLRRRVNTAAYLRATGHPPLRRYADLWTVIDFVAALRTAVAGLMRDRGHRLAICGLLARLAAGPGVAGWASITRHGRLMASARRYRAASPGHADLDALFARRQNAAQAKPNAAARTPPKAVP